MVKPDQVKSLLDLADPKWKDKIAIPNSGSEYLQAGVSVIRATHGDEKTKQFLQGLKTNADSQVYQKSSQIVDAVAKGQVALGIVNHYYVYRHLAAQPGAPIAVLMPDQQEGGMGAIMNVAGHRHHQVDQASRQRQVARRILSRTSGAEVVCGSRQGISPPPGREGRPGARGTEEFPRGTGPPLQTRRTARADAHADRTSGSPVTRRDPP